MSAKMTRDQVMEMCASQSAQAGELWLNQADLSGIDLSDCDLRGAHLREANLSTANLKAQT